MPVRRGFGFAIYLHIFVLRVLDDDCRSIVVREEVLLAVDHVHDRCTPVQRDLRRSERLAHHGEAVRGKRRMSTVSDCCEGSYSRIIKEDECALKAK